MQPIEVPSEGHSDPGMRPLRDEAQFSDALLVNVILSIESPALADALSGAAGA
ncbi:hypothetical protein [Caballeronia sp. S22]|uniref:hypothetical protein n=1 Tax=Caballeronia sp. S22 TaxID=3137182 RepID=UPI003530CD81